MEVRAVSHPTIGQSAKRTRVNVGAIRYDERRGPLPQPPRRASGYRQYSQDDVVSLRFIRQAKTLGFPLKGTAELLAKNFP
jgi:MerR family transcriptional regulator, copper efflux regulator